ncbi:MAG: tRNA (uridine(34)/cytosine(34)/5-carboxymethylaminomethyluridine(34)-2'-O)-methyltransferase TrmL [Clostridiales bacterium]|nr:tRNA (uridine(34)/cytosine(34)/5-carboxymethylaminomethyluridine(34)-2'-O)-methyltransferase TrmL [Clostridiales bacterium]
MINVVLVEPEIPQNTGNIARTCACTGARLHLVRPFGFEISDRTVKRAGLDYWDKVEIFYYDSLDDFFAKNAGGKFFYLSTKAKQTYTDVDIPDESFLLFGKETKGLPEKLVFDNPDSAIRIPMGEALRSLNLANSVAIVVYDVLRRNGFPGLR